MKERIPSFSHEENAHQKTVDSIIELLKGKSVEDAETILYQILRNIKTQSKIT